MGICADVTGNATSGVCCEVPGGESQTTTCIDAPSTDDTPNDKDDDTKKLSPGAIVGISIGGFAGLVLLVVLVRHVSKGTKLSTALDTKLGSLVF